MPDDFTDQEAVTFKQIFETDMDDDADERTALNDSGGGSSSSTSKSFIDPAYNKCLCVFIPLVLGILLVVLISLGSQAQDSSSLVQHRQPGQDAPTTSESGLDTADSPIPDPTTNAPTTTNSPTTKAPTPPTIRLIDDSPVTSLEDPRYGPREIEVSETRKQTWLNITHIRSDWAKTWKETIVNVTIDGKALDFKNGDDANAYRTTFCQSQESLRPPLKYIEPDFSKLSSRTTKAADMARHYRQYRAFLADYYELPQNLPFTIKPKGMENLQSIFYDVLTRDSKTLVLGFQGSSVMAGMDNCHYWIYSETMKRQFERLLKPYDIKVEVRNMAFNGDGPDQNVQMLCAPDSMGDKIDLMHIWYPMMPQSKPGDKAMYLRRMITKHKKVFFHLVDFEDEGKLNPFENFFFRYDQSWFDWGIYDKAIHWGDGWEGGWGKIGDGRCHLTTRENQCGVWMWNWHFGPMGFQMLVDSAMTVYVEAIARVLDKQVPAWDGTLPKVQPFEKPFGGLARWSHVTGEKFPGFCGITWEPYFEPQVVLNSSWHVLLSDPSNPFPRGNPFNKSVGFVEWNYPYVKGPSTGHQFQKEKYHPPGTCGPEAFPDKSWIYAVPGVRQQTDSEWLTFKLPSLAQDRLKDYDFVDIVICAGQRGGGRGATDQGNFFRYANLKPPVMSTQYGLNGSPVGEAKAFVFNDQVNVFDTCMIAAERVPKPKAKDVFGIAVRKNPQVYVDPKNRGSEGPLFNSMVILGVP